MIILNFINAVIILGLIMVPQIFYFFSDHVIDDTTPSGNVMCLGKYEPNNTDVIFFPANENHSQCCTELYQHVLEKAGIFDENLSLWNNLKDFVLSLLTG